MSETKVSYTTPAQRLAAVIGRCFSTQSAKTRDALRYAAYSKFTGREIGSSKDLSDSEIEKMLQVWEHFDTPFTPSERAIMQCPELAQDYQREHGQVDLFAPADAADETPSTTDAVTFEAVIYGQRTDGDGETKLTLVIPRQDLKAMRALLGLDSKRLGVAISLIEGAK
jgi:hypothetical protein